MKLVESRTATLDTLSVTIQALHVSGKQMTLAVFRQLPEGLEDESSDLWGVVRYGIKESPPLWLVFSDGGILKRRNLVNLRRPSYADASEEEWTNFRLEKIVQEINALKISIPHRLWGDENRKVSIKEQHERIVYELTEKYNVEKAYLIDERRKELAMWDRDTRLSRLTQLFIAV